jgi:hypothetical protein
MKAESKYIELSPIKAGAVSWGHCYTLLYTAGLPTSTESTATTFADDTAVLAKDCDPGIASQEMQTNPDARHIWLKKWRIKANEAKSVHVMFATRTETCPPVHINNAHPPQQEDVTYLGLHLESRLTWCKHIFTKWKQLGMTITKMHWLLARKSKLSTSNKILIHKAIFKPIWTYGIQLWGMASTSNIEILERFQSKVLCMTVDAPWYMPNTVIQRDFQIPTVEEEICH